jgi:hypothetical protein
MQAVVLTNPRQISIEDVAEPQLQATTNVDAPNAFVKFDARSDDHLKIVLEP